MSKVIEVTIAVMPSGDALELQLPISTSGKQIKQEILAAEDDGKPLIPFLDNEGNKIIYELISNKGKIPDNTTLEELNIQNGDRLSMVPDLIAG